MNVEGMIFGLKNKTLQENNTNNTESNLSFKITSKNYDPKKLCPKPFNNFRNNKTLPLYKSVEISKNLNNTKKFFSESKDYKSFHNIYNFTIKKTLGELNNYITFIPIASLKHKNEIKSTGNAITSPKRKTFLPSLPANRTMDKKSFVLNLINDDSFYRTSKPKKKKQPMRNFYITKPNTFIHDSNNNNAHHLFTDYTKSYELNSYRIKGLIEKDRFVNKIKKDLMRMKYDCRPKMFEELY